MGMIKEFREFAMRGNVMDMAIGIVIGGAFGKIVSSFVSDVIMPPIGMLINGANFADMKVILKEAAIDASGDAIPAVTLNYGSFIQTVLDFIIIAIAIFLVIKAINKYHNAKKKEEAPAPPQEPVPTKEEQLLSEIRDLLKKNN